MTRKLLLTMALMGGIAAGAKAQAFVYRPVNPAFGGNTFNYQWMLSSAQAQDKTKDPAQRTSGSQFRTTTSSLDDFSNSLQRQILNQLSRQVIGNQFSEDNLREGTYQFGDFQVTITNAADGVLIRIVDGRGGETTVTVPYF